MTVGGSITSQLKILIGLKIVLIYNLFSSNSVGFYAVHICRNKHVGFK